MGACVVINEIWYTFRIIRNGAAATQWFLNVY